MSRARKKKVKKVRQRVEKKPVSVKKGEREVLTFHAGRPSAVHRTPCCRTLPLALLPLPYLGFFTQGVENSKLNARISTTEVKAKAQRWSSAKRGTKKRLFATRKKRSRNARCAATSYDGPDASPPGPGHRTRGGAVEVVAMVFEHAHLLPEWRLPQQQVASADFRSFSNAEHQAQAPTTTSSQEGLRLGWRCKSSLESSPAEKPLLRWSKARSVHTYTA